MLLLNRRTILSQAVAALAATVALRPGPMRAAAGDDPVEHIVEIRAFKFAPDVQPVMAGDRITWVNRDIVPHTATASDKSWDTGTIPKGGSKTVTITHGMSVEYFCRFHPMMKASLDLAGNT